MDPGRRRSRGERWLAGLPAFLVGAAAATAGELTAGLLLYSGQGLLRGLTVVLATEMLGLSLGLAASRRLDPGDLGAVRRRWLLLLVAFGAAAAFSAGWSVGRGFEAARPAQILGLGVLGGFPLFAAGSVLGALARTERDRPAPVAAAAALGAASGVLAAGLLGVPRLEPTSLFLLSVVAVSAGALLHGWLVDRRLVVRVLSNASPGGDGSEVRLEERIHGASATSGRVLSVDGRAVDGVTDDDEPLLSWQRAALAVLSKGRRSGSRVLVVGVGTGALLRRLRGSTSAPGPVAVEPLDDVRALRPWNLAGSDPGAVVEGEGDPHAQIPETTDRSDRFDAVVVNLALLPPDGPVALSGREMLKAVLSRRSPEGVLLVGGVSVEESEGVQRTVERLAEEGGSPLRMRLFRPSERRGGPADRLLRSDERDRDGLLLGSPGNVAPAGGPPGFEAVGGGRGGEPAGGTGAARSEGSG